MVLVICEQRSRGRHTNLDMEQLVGHLWSAGKGREGDSPGALPRPGEGPREASRESALTPTRRT
jgi:hypothetical protein